MRLSTRSVVAQYGLVECMHEVMTVREKQKLVRLVSIGLRFEIPVGANIHCYDYVISLTSNGHPFARSSRCTVYGGIEPFAFSSLLTIQTPVGYRFVFQPKLSHPRRKVNPLGTVFSARVFHSAVNTVEMPVTSAR